MREIFTYGSVGGWPENRPALPGQLRIDRFLFHQRVLVAWSNECPPFERGGKFLATKMRLA